MFCLAMEFGRIKTPLLILLTVLYCNGDSITNMKIGGRKRMNLTEGITYNFMVDATNAFKANSSFVFQIHADIHNVSLTNTSKACNITRECQQNGKNVGLVQLLYSGVNPIANFSVCYSCATNNSGCSTKQEVLVAVAGIAIKDPVPGGCSLTSALEVDAHLTITRNSISSSVTFQDSDIGYDPLISLPPVCSDSFHFITRLKYQVYRKCLVNPSTDAILNTVESMLTAQDILKDKPLYSAKELSYSDAKRVLYFMTRKQVMIVNVIALQNNNSNYISAYIPAVSYGCDQQLEECTYPIPVTTMVCGPLIGIVGLILCIFAHRFFHAEVVFFMLLISSYIMYGVLSSATTWSNTEITVGTVVLGLTLTFLFFVLWFFTNWYYLFVMFFASSMGFVVAATVLFTPLGSYSVLTVPYVYALLLLCGMLLFVLPIFIPTFLNIMASSFIGSYAVIFSIGMFVDSILNDIILGVLKTISIPGFLSAGGDSCDKLDTIELILSCLWGFLFVMSIITQVVLEIFRRRSFKRSERLRREFLSGYREPYERRYNPFPSSSLFFQLKKYFKKRSQSSSLVKVKSTRRDDRSRPHAHALADERRPLLSPNSMSPTKRNTFY